MTALDGTHERAQRLRRYVEQELARNHPSVDLDRESLVDSGVIDSLGIMKLVAFIERELGVKIPDEELLPERFDTLRTISALVEERRRAR
ncbi:acyl carrier protein [Myxococcota bacterium]|nr:acyl carrier protein [Myxococcota bacterium]